MPHPHPELICGHTVQGKQSVELLTSQLFLWGGGCFNLGCFAISHEKWSFLFVGVLWMHIFCTYWLICSTLHRFLDWSSSQLMEIEIAGSSFKARFMSWKCNSPRKLMPQVRDLNRSFQAVSEYHLFKDNMSKFPRDIHYSGWHLIICCTGVNMKEFSLHK